MNDISENEELVHKWTRLMDNAKFKSVNAGRSSPIPNCNIRADDKQSATKLRSEIGTGKIKRSGSHAYLLLGPDALRALIPLVKDNLQKSYREVEIIEEWLNLLNKNTLFSTTNDNIEKNRARILELKKNLIDLNINRESDFGIVKKDDNIAVMRAELATYDKIPKFSWTPFIKNRVVSLLETITAEEPNGHEAKQLEAMRKEEYGK